MRRSRTTLTLALPGVLAAAVLPVGAPVAHAAPAHAAASTTSAARMPLDAPGSGSVESSAAAAAAAAPCSPVFSSAFAASLARDFPRQRVTASVYDTRT